MKIVVGSRNKAKLRAVELAFEAYKITADIVGIDVASGVADQPLTIADTAQGALNRARAALQNSPDATLGIGLEGGVMQPVLDDEGLQPYTMGFIAITDGTRAVVMPTTGTPLPAKFFTAMQQGKAEMRPLAQAMGMPYDYEDGVLGILTRGMVRRVDSDSMAVRAALALWLNAEAYEAADRLAH